MQFRMEQNIQKINAVLFCKEKVSKYEASVIEKSLFTIKKEKKKKKGFEVEAETEGINTNKSPI